MTLDQEVKEALVKIPGHYEILESWEPIADLLSDSFDWAGSKIDWSKTISHDFQMLKGDLSQWSDSAATFAALKIASFKLDTGDIVYYVSDSALDFSVRLNVSQLVDFVRFIVLAAPQHHYFFNADATWCLVVSSEGYIDFGLAKK